MELVNMWNMKPHEPFNEKKKDQGENLFSSGNLLTQLLVSQAILDSNEFQILPFEKLDKLKKVIQNECFCILLTSLIIGILGATRTH